MLQECFARELSARQDTRSLQLCTCLDQNSASLKLGNKNFPSALCTGCPAAARCTILYMLPRSSVPVTIPNTIAIGMPHGKWMMTADVAAHEASTGGIPHINLLYVPEQSTANDVMLHSRKLADCWPQNKTEAITYKGHRSVDRGA